MSFKIKARSEHFETENHQKLRTLSLIKILLVLVKKAGYSFFQRFFECHEQVSLSELRFERYFSHHRALAKISLCIFFEWLLLKIPEKIKAYSKSTTKKQKNTKTTSVDIVRMSLVKLQALTINGIDGVGGGVRFWLQGLIESVISEVLGI